MRTILIFLFLLLPTVPLRAQSLVGETHREADHSPAALRDSAHRPRLRITAWYPAAPGAIEQPIVIGPDAHPIFVIGNAAMDAPPAGLTEIRPVILLSHGFGGAARIMGWFGIALARAGYIVIAVDHPGNNGMDSMTVPGALLTWERAGDLHRALEVMLADRILGPHIDPARVGLAGFSAGGFTALIAAGARVDRKRLARFCAGNPTDGVCKPQDEFAVTLAQRTALEADPTLSATLREASKDHSIANVRAAFAMAPAIVQGLAPSSLRRIRVPVSIMLGAEDLVAPPTTNGATAARLIPHARLAALPGVGHYAFLANCAPDAQLPICGRAPGRIDAHAEAIRAAIDLFRTTLQPPANGPS